MWRTFLGACFTAFISILLLCYAIYFTPNLVAKYLSPYGIFVQHKLFFNSFIRFGVGILSATGLLISCLYITRPNIVRQFYSNQHQIRILKLILFLFPIVFVICTILLKYFIPPLYLGLMVRQYGLNNWLKSLLYFIAFIVALRISITFYRSNSILFGLMYMLLSLGFFFISMEEIRWGVPIFGWETPEWFSKHNLQNEITIHNLKWFPIRTLYAIVGFYGAFSRFVIPKNVKMKYRSTVNLFVPDYYLFFYFFIVGIFYFYVGITDWQLGNFLIPKDQEPLEFLLACGFLFFVTINKCRQVRNKTYHGT